MFPECIRRIIWCRLSSDNFLVTCEKQSFNVTIILAGLAARTAVNPRRIEEDRRNIQRQSANTVRTREVEEEIGIWRAIKDPEAVTRETEIKDVIVPARAGHTLRIVQEEKLDPHPEKSHEAPPVVRNRIKQKLTQRKTKS